MAETPTPTPEPSAPAADATVLEAAQAAAPGTGAAGAQAADAGADNSPPEAAPADDKPQAGAPEGKYELAMPEGVTLNQEAYDKLEPFLKEANVGPKQAQALAEKVYPTLMETVRAELATANEVTFNETATKWATDAKSDPDIGSANGLASIATFRDRFLDADTRAFLDTTRLGNFPGLLKAFKAAGEAIGEGRIVNGGADAPAPKAKLSDLYTSMEH